VDIGRLNSCVEQILQRPRVDWLLESENVDLVVDILSHDKDHIDYFADHAERIIFWIDDFSMNKLTAWRAMPGITTATQISKPVFKKSAFVSLISVFSERGLEIEYWYASKISQQGFQYSTGDMLIFFHRHCTFPAQLSGNYEV
jgi:hypothetical protein